MRLKAEELKKLINSKNFTKMKELLNNCLAADIVDLMKELTHYEKIIIFRFLDKDRAAEVFSHIDEKLQRELLDLFTDEHIKDIIHELSPDDRTQLLDELPAGIVKKLLHHLPPDKRQEAYELLNYKNDSAGRLMTPEFVDLKENMTVDEAIVHIRKVADEKETIYYGYVTDDKRKLLGIVSLRKILMAKPIDKIGEIMDKNIIFVDTDTDKEQVAEIIKKYDFLAIPVVDKEQRLVGIITVDDIMDISEDEATEDIHKMAAIETQLTPYLKTSFLRLARKRILWLIILLIASAIGSATIIEKNEKFLHEFVILAIFIPALMNISGSTGIQSATLIIRGLALGEVKLKNTFYVFLRELLMGIFIGVVLSVIIFLRVLLTKEGDPYFGVIVSISLITAVCCANLVGALLPLLAKLLRIDPALMAGPLITTLMDVTTLSIYFLIAKTLL